MGKKKLEQLSFQVKGYVLCRAVFLLVHVGLNDGKDDIWSGLPSLRGLLINSSKIKLRIIFLLLRKNVESFYNDLTAFTMV